ncbi:Dynein light chain roadblock-type 2 [Nowakowskiella sp. JEL0078]|nr:Dynein light chain roadblock-type 2 [Nowakowskiella sp. JEL0078]
MEGISIRSTLDPEKTVQYAALITQLTAKARSVVRELDPQVIYIPFKFSNFTETIPLFAE